MYHCFLLLVGLSLIYITHVNLCSAETDFQNPMRAYMAKAIEKSLHNQQSLSREQGNLKPCCYPKTWQGLMYSYNSAAYVEYALMMYEDSVTQNIALDVTVTQGDSKTPTKYFEIVKFDAPSKSAVVYIFDKVAKTCQSGKLPNTTYDTLSQQCMPSDAFYFGTINIGIVAGEHVAVNSFMWKPFPDQQPDLHYERLVTNDCAPAFELYRGQLSNGQPVLQTDYFFNIQTSISDPSVFIVPDYCKPPLVQDSTAHSLKESFLFKRLRG